MGEDQDPSHSKLMGLNKIRFVSDEGNGSLVLSLHPLSQHQKFMEKLPLPVIEKYVL